MTYFQQSKSQLHFQKDNFSVKIPKFFEGEAVRAVKRRNRWPDSVTISLKRGFATIGKQSLVKSLLTLHSSALTRQTGPSSPRLFYPHVGITHRCVNFVKPEKNANLMQYSFLILTFLA